MLMEMLSELVSLPGSSSSRFIAIWSCKLNWRTKSTSHPYLDRLRWDSWADDVALGKDAPTGDDLIELVEQRLFPTLKNLDLDSMSGTDT